ncbi:MAG: hypothetical protein C4325_02850 [Blastocatellia bacterium]
MNSAWKLSYRTRITSRFVFKALYRFEDTGIGARFIDITSFEQTLIAETINHRIAQERIPLIVDSFEAPKKYIGEEDYSESPKFKRLRERMLDEAISIESLD